MKQEDVHYIKVPVPMLRFFLQKPSKDTLLEIFKNGVFLAAMTLTVDEENVVRQLLYIERHEGKNPRIRISDELLNFVKNQYDSEGDDVGYDFGCEGFCPTDNDCGDLVAPLREHLNSQPKFKAKAIEFYKLRQFISLIDFRRFDTVDIQKVHRKYKKFDSEPFAYCNVNVVWDFFENFERKSEDDLALFLLYSGIKSIVGSKPIARAGKSFILARAVGAVNKAQMKELMEKEHVKKFVERYSQRYHWDLIIGRLQKFKFILRIQSLPKRPGAGYFISTRQMSDEEFCSRIIEIVKADKQEKTRKRVERFRRRNNVDKSSINSLLEKSLED